MKITHKMTVTDRLREILRVTGWKQKALMSLTKLLIPIRRITMMQNVLYWLKKKIITLTSFYILLLIIKTTVGTKWAEGHCFFTKICWLLGWDVRQKYVTMTTRHIDSEVASLPLDGVIS